MMKSHLAIEDLSATEDQLSAVARCYTTTGQWDGLSNLASNGDAVLRRPTANG